MLASERYKADALSCVNHLRFHASCLINSGAKHRTVVCIDRSLLRFFSYIYVHMVMSLFRSSQSGVSQEPGGALIRFLYAWKETSDGEGTTRDSCILKRHTHTHNSVTYLKVMCIAAIYIYSLSIHIFRMSSQRRWWRAAHSFHIVFIFVDCTAKYKKKNIYWTLLCWIRHRSVDFFLMRE